jgi:crotonobetainyl-CoA:carnitine CoA-transferase CaiB-like acyl-CoA transferase
MDKEKQAGRPGPLSGVIVVEYGVFHAGPGASAILGDLGATVIKIEEGKGDPERFWTVVAGISIAGKNGESFMFDVSNRNKQGLCLDIKSQKGQEIFFRLIKKADVFLTNLRKSTKAKMGLDYQSIRAINPKIIHANVSGYGDRGPNADMGAFDPMGQARSGMMFLHDQQEPSLIHLAILDQATAIAASHAVITALFFRERHGVGQEVHTSLFSTGLWLLYCNMVMTSLLKVDPSFRWERHDASPLRNSFLCKDNKWILGVHHPDSKYWPNFCKATGQIELMDDPRYADAKGRHQHRRELVEHFDRVIAQKNSDEWMEIFSAHGLMFSPVQRMEDVLNDPQALANNFVVNFEHPALGTVKIPGYPIEFSECDAGTSSIAPRIGEHSTQVLEGLGYSKDEIDALLNEGVVSQHEKKDIPA